MIFDRLLDIFRGKAVTIPPLDGAFRPNTALDERRGRCVRRAPDNLCRRWRPHLLAISGNAVFALSRRKPSVGRRLRRAGDSARRLAGGRPGVRARRRACC